MIITGGFPSLIITQGFGEEYTAGIELHTAIRVSLSATPAMTVEIGGPSVSVECGAPSLAVGIEKSTAINLFMEKI